MDGVRRQARGTDDLTEAQLRLQALRPAEDHLEVIQDTAVVTYLGEQLGCVGRVVGRLVNVEAWSRPQSLHIVVGNPRTVEVFSQRN